MDPKADEEHFDTDHLRRNLRGRSVRGGAVTLGAQGLKLLLRLGSTAILARLLLPEDFGLLAMVMAVTGLVILLKDAGLSFATIQRPEIEHAQVNALFWLNVGLSMLLMAGTASLAPAIAWLYGEPRLVGITLGIAVSIVFSGLAIQHEALLRRQMRFVSLAAVEIGSQLIGIVCAVWMAWRGYGYWSLVAMHLAAQIAEALLAWALCDWRPSRPRWERGVGSMVAFGGQLTAGKFFSFFSSHADNLLIGMFWGSTAVGLYTKAYQLLMVPIQQISAPLTAAAVPILSRLQEDPEEFRRYYLKGVSYLTFFAMPVSAFAFVASKEIVGILLGDGWEGAVPIFRVLAPAALMICFNAATGWVFVPLGQGGRQMRAALYGSVVTVLAFLAGLPWGPIGVAAAFTLSTPVRRIPQILYAYARAPVKMKHLVRAISRPLAASIAAAAITQLCDPFLPPGLLGRFFSSLGVFALSYLLLFCITSSGRIFLCQGLRHARMLGGYSPSSPRPGA